MKEVSFSIKAPTFTLYRLFKAEAESAGWVYNKAFNDFDEIKMESCNCLYFCTNWRNVGMEGKAAFSFSNSTTKPYKLPAEWDEAVRALRQVNSHVLYSSTIDELIERCAKSGVDVVLRKRQ